jgi:hypothetical protein
VKQAPSISVRVSCFGFSSTLKMEETCSYETLVDFKRTTRRYNPGERNLHVRIPLPSIRFTPSARSNQFDMIKLTISGELYNIRRFYFLTSSISHQIRSNIGRIPGKIQGYYPQQTGQRGRPLKRWNDQITKKWDRSWPIGQSLLDDDDD